MKNKYNKTDIRGWKGGKIIIDAIKKSKRKVLSNEKFEVWRPENLEILK